MRTSKAFLAPGIGLLGVAMCVAPGMASDATGGFALHGVGAQTCQMMLQELPQAVSAAPAAGATAPGTPAPGTPASGASASGTAAPGGSAPGTSASGASPSGTTAATGPGAAAAAPAAATPTQVAPAPIALAAAGQAAATPSAGLPQAAAMAGPATAAPPAAAPGAGPAAGTAAATTASAAGAPGGASGAPSPAPAAHPPSPAAAASGLSMRPILTSWIMGYLTASDRLAKDTFDETPVMAPEALTTMIVGVCQRNPDARVESVANNVLNQLAAARVLHESPVVEARAGDRVVLIREATLVAMQTSLAKDKLLTAPADGKFGSSTAAALLAFQKSQNLPETGLPDPSTVVRLLIELPAKAPVKRGRTNR